MNALDLAKRTIEDLYTKYSDDDQIFAKMHNYVCFRLPGVVEEMKRASDERRMRNEFLTGEQDEFISAFLNDNRYFYCQQTELFFYYNGVHYITKREDDVLHHILTSITKERHALMPRKPQTKVYIMKRVKEANPLKSIPESATIQSVLDSLCPALFRTKTAAKYFLTVVGDHLLKKCDETTHAYFATHKAKEFLREVAAISQALFGLNAVALFKYKYHLHPLKTVRLVPINDSITVESVWRPILQLNAIDLLCVAAHYSGRYESADQFLESYSDDVELTKYATHFRWKCDQDIVGDFAGEYLRVSESADAAISAPTMEYLWKKYLKDRQFPAVLGSQAFLTAMAERFPGGYDREANCFRRLTSTHAGIVDRFQRFWEDHIVADKTDPLAEYEIDELVAMYRESGDTGSSRITDAQMLDLIRFYKDVDIIDGKFVQGVKSALWDKQEDLRVFFADLARTAAETDKKTISFYDAYSEYQRRTGCLLKGRQRKSQIVSKNYFEKYIYDAFDATDGKLVF